MTEIPSRNTSSSSELWHALEGDETLRLLGADPGGLATAEAAARLTRYGPNILPRGKRDGVFTLLWRQINNPLIWVLIASGAISMAVDPTGGLKNGLVILAVVVLSSVIGFAQEYSAGRAIDELSNMVPEGATVLRDGKRVSVAREELVPGDTVILSGGDRVPADLRILKARNLQADEASLTGESVPVAKSPSPLPPDAVLGDRTCMLYAGTLVSAGSAVAAVVETGAHTELGRISGLLRETTDVETPLTRDLGTIGHYISVAIVVVAAVILAVGAWRTVAEAGVGWVMAVRETVIFGIALAVGAIPEGLPAIVTIALAIGVRRMAARRTVVRKLPAVETLGSTTVICTDKTGTLTRNEMTVQKIWVPDIGILRVSGVGFAPEGELLRDGLAVEPDAAVRDVLLTGALCNDASLSNDGRRWVIQGDPTEAALIVAARKLGLDLEAEEAEHPRLDSIPFESENQYMATLHGGDRRRILLKGAPEAVLARCGDAAERRLDPEATMARVEDLAGDGLRVLAFAEKAVQGLDRLGAEDLADGFRFLGIQAMMDPPRPEAIEAVRTCRTAGITVKMITGDHRATAQAVGRSIGLIDETSTGEQSLVGMEIDALSDADLEEAALRCNVFARVAPVHKLRLVQALQRRGEVVAMTGDGVNDAPALKQANIGVAMGITGTSVSKSVADLVLTDDNFASVAAAVEEGRRVYDNLVKSLAFVLPTNLALALIMGWAVAFFPFTQVVHKDGSLATALLLPMSPTQLLWINLVAAVALALPLAFEAMESDIMRRPPRDPREPVLSSFVVVRTVIVSVVMTAGAVALFNYELEAHEVGQAAATANAQTIAVTAIVAFQIFYLFSCRSLRHPVSELGFFSNRFVFAGVGITVALQAVFIYAPLMNTVFGSAPLPVWDLVGSIAAAAAVIPLLAVERRLWRLARRER